MEVFRIFDEENHKNWLKGVVGLRLLQNLLECFINKQIDIFHQALRRECSDVCGNKCHLKNWKLRPNQVPILDCEVCSHWRDVIWTNNNSQGGKVMWMNSEPHMWSQDKWEVAKVYMTGGHKNHKSIGQFDIVALLSLMTQCNHFKKFKLGGLCEQVANVRNNIMHSPNYQLKREELNGYLSQIRDLGEVLAKHDPVFKYLSGDINEIQNLDFRLTFPDNIQQQQKKFRFMKKN
ncbi:uncharacterized protein CXorf38 homolog isoform X2 [Micropterus salmoides]|uniref:uncharacterized protein CXorf38 homolog isoform X2 n=1 Tax=Micropterus salmoides TaxID=27706 RepID=UPI0018EDEC98|nr:uncharacterized protein CXorf38 homolog isoform X2 [Micropterus salmoides]